MRCLPNSFGKNWIFPVVFVLLIVAFYFASPCYKQLLKDLAEILVAPAIAYIGFSYNKKMAELENEKHRLESERFKMDMFDRRVKIYEAAMELIQSGIGLRVKDDTIRAYKERVAGAYWLFDDDLVHYLRLLSKKAVELKTIGAKIEIPVSGGVGRSNLCDKELQLAEWFIEEQSAVQDRFAPFMRFSSAPSKTR